MSEPTSRHPDDHETMVGFFTDDDWYPEEQAEGIIGMRFHGENGEWGCFAEARRPPGQFLFYSVLTPVVPEEDLLRMAELLTWVNELLLVGNFELDLSSGQVRFKTSIALGDEPLTAGLVRASAYLNVTTMDRCLPLLLTLIETNETPEQIASMLTS